MVARSASTGRCISALTPATDITNVFDGEVVISMLPDDNAVRNVVFGREDRGIDGSCFGGREATGRGSGDAMALNRDVSETSGRSRG
jgi:hypothetical protein